MVAALEALPGRPQGLKSSSLKKPVTLRMRGLRILVDSDGSVRSMDSLAEGRSLFGFEQAWVYKLQAGVVVQAQRQDWLVRPGPRSVAFSGRVFDAVDVAQALEFFRGGSSGYLRHLRLKNISQGNLRLRVIDMSDPTAAQFGEISGRWGSLGVNAFNRESHVAMDEVSDPPSARVVGGTPSPSRFYMTTDRSRAQDLLAAGELPDATAGMSGQVLVLSSHDIELAPGEMKELTFASIYNPLKLESALSAFGVVQKGERQTSPRGFFIASSDEAITDSAAWATSAIDASRFAAYRLDRYEALRALSYSDPQSAQDVFTESKSIIRKDGSLPHSSDSTRPGILETALFLRGASAHFLLAQDKKLARSFYPLMKKLASYLIYSSKDFTILTDKTLPQGWRRFLGRGYPTGEIPEVTLAVAAALASAAKVSRFLSKSEDAGKFAERAAMITDGVKTRLIDDRGFLSLCRDSSGRLRNDETIDMAIACYRHQFNPSAEQAAAHRLIEKDFDTPYGPRCVPDSNRVYFNRTYGRGQLGAVWTRAALAHANLCYRVGMAGIGSLALKKVAKLVGGDIVRLGGSPGEFAQWVDPDRGEAHGEDTDYVAASRFIEAILLGELGMPSSPDRASFSPPDSSGLGWVMVSDFWAGGPSTAFVGRAAGKAHLFFSGGPIETKVGNKFTSSEQIDLAAKGVFGISLFGPGQIICLGNSTSSAARVAVNFSPRAADLSKHLSVPLEAYDPPKESWTKTGTLRVLPTMTFEASLGPNEWRAFRISSF
ncbi:MAG TPA: hypothetical protein VGR56_02800 [Nitrososphaerales archaeon]|nr:hypothetical protein [Nitrososphaerales archaeon]